MGRFVLEVVVPLWLLGMLTVAGWEALALTEGARRRQRRRLARKADKASRKGRRFLADHYEQELKQLESKHVSPHGVEQRDR